MEPVGERFCRVCPPFFLVAVFLGCSSTGQVGLCFLWFFVQELPKAQPAVVLVLKRLRRRGKSHPTGFVSYINFGHWQVYMKKLLLT